MKKILLSGAIALLTALGLNAQDFRLVYSGEPIPQAALPILEQRISQMLAAEDMGLTQEEDAPALEVSAKVTSRMETPGSMSQVAITLDLSLSSGEVSEVFLLKGVGADEADAWTRAFKMLLPRSKAASTFVLKLK